MCRPASFVLTKNKEFWSTHTDSHEDIIDEHKLAPDGTRGPNVLRVEIVPPDGDLSAPPRKWLFGYDQDILPSWADRERDEARTRAALRSWRRERLVLRGDRIITGGHVYVMNASAELCGNARAVLCDNASAVLWGNARAELWDNASAVLRDNARATLRGNASAVLCDNAIATIYSSNASFDVQSKQAVALDRTGDCVVAITMATQQTTLASLQENIDGPD